MKKLTFLMLAFAAHNAQAASPFAGVYVSAAAGGTLLDSQVEQTISVSKPSLVSGEFPSDNDAEGLGGAGWVALGYSYQSHNHFVLGLEATAGQANPEADYTHSLLVAGHPFSSEIKTQLKNDFALLFKPGYVIKERTQLYGFVGPRWGNMESHLSSNVTGAIAHDKVSGYELGVTAGLGIAHLVTDHLSVGLEYAYTNYGDIASPNTTSEPFIEGLGSVVTAHDNPDLSVNTNTVAVQLSYHFM
jgi:opacity protein-like surface antigen